MNDEEMIDDIITEAEEENASSGTTIELTSEELEDIIKNAVKAALKEREEEKALEQYELETKGLVEEEPVPHVIIDSFESVPDVNVKNIDSGKDEEFDYSTITDAIYSLKDEPLEFATDTDSGLYSGSSVATSSATQQMTAYMLDCRNILLIFCVLWFSVYLIKMIHRRVMIFTKGKGDNV